MRFLNWPLLLLLIPVLAMMLFKKQSSIGFSNINKLKAQGRKSTVKHKIGKWLMTLALCSLIIGLARPQIPGDRLPQNGKGIDIMMIFDVSGSMESVDIKPTRLEVARTTIENFIKSRFDDRIGLIIFAGSAYTRVPLTLDHQVVLSSLDSVTTDSVGEKGTAIGMAVSVGINRLKKSEASSKIMILVTDGDNNAGSINPETAADLAKQSDIKVYSIGVGTDQTILPVNFMGATRYQTMDSGLNEPLLQSIADTTGGVYFRAEDQKDFTEIFNEINQLEKTDFERDAFQAYDDLAFLFIKIGLGLLLIGILFDRYIFIHLP